jgi:hypothetical protein
MAFKTREFFKLVAEDGIDMWAREIDYIDAIGYTLYKTDIDPNVKPRVCTDQVLHASVRLTDAHRHVKPHGVAKYGYFRVLKVHGTPVCKDPQGRKYGFYEFDVLREVLDPDEIFNAVLSENQNIWRPYSHPRVWNMTEKEAVESCQKWFLACRPGWED